MTPFLFCESFTIADQRALPRRPLHPRAWEVYIHRRHVQICSTCVRRSWAHYVRNRGVQPHPWPRRSGHGELQDPRSVTVPVSLAPKPKLYPLCLFRLCRAFNVYSFFVAFPGVIADFLPSLSFMELARIIVWKVAEVLETDGDGSPVGIHLP